MELKENIEVVEKNILETYVDGAIPQLLDLAIDVVFACLVFFVGTKIVKWAVNLIRRSMDRANAEAGVTTFVCSLCKYALYFLLILVIL